MKTINNQYVSYDTNFGNITIFQPGNYNLSITFILLDKADRSSTGTITIVQNGSPIATYSTPINFLSTTSIDASISFTATAGTNISLIYNGVTTAYIGGLTLTSTM